MRETLSEIREVHDELCFAVYDLLSELRPAYAASASYRASIIVSLMHGFYLVALSFFIRPDASQHRAVVLALCGAFGLFYGIWCEKVIAKREPIWKEEI